MKTYKALLAVVFLSVFFSTAHAANYYVRVDGNDACNGTVDAAGVSGNCAKQTVQAGVDLLLTGDSLYVGDGDYSAVKPTFTTKASGTSIIAQANAAIISRARIEHDATTLSGFTISKPGGYWIAGVAIGDNDPVIVVDNCVITGCKIKPDTVNAYGVWIKGSGNTIENSEFSTDNVVGFHTGDSGVAVLQDTSKVLVDDALVGKIIWNRTDNSTGVVTSNTSNTIAATLAGGTDNDFDTGDYYVVGGHLSVAVSLNGGDGNIISGNTFNGLGDIERVFDVSVGSNHVISGNTVSDCLWSGESGVSLNTVHPDFIQQVGGGTSKNVIVEKNYVYDSPGMQIGQLSANDDSSSETYGWIFRNNIFSDAAPLFVYLQCEIYNNTFYECSSSNNPIIIRKAHLYGDGSNSTVSNNAFVGCGSSSDAYGWYDLGTSTGTTGMAATNNFVSKSDYTAKIGFTESTGINGGNPLFTLEGSDFSIQTSSPLKDAGADLSSAWANAVDYIDVARPSGTGWDIGAYEFDSSSDPPATITRAASRQSDHGAGVVFSAYGAR